MQPTYSSITYQVSTEDLDVIETQDYGLVITNTEPGLLNHLKNGLHPSDFRQNADSNYTFLLTPKNYQQNMEILLTLPDEIVFSGPEIKCYGL